jgi:tetratricopeptide (TPR) repeat protein
VISALALATGLTVVSAAPSGGPANTWACAYVGDRLPQSLRMLGEDAVSSEDTRAARKKLMLSDAILTRASSLTLARAVGATRLVIVRCVEQKETITLEAQTFDVDQPVAGEPLRVSQPSSDATAAVDVLARRLAPKAPATIVLKAPSAKALAKAGPALKTANANERAAGLTQAVLEDPGAIGLRLTAVEALMAARDFDRAIRIADAVGANVPANALGRSLRFSMGASLLEAGRYSEARDVIEGLRKDKETAAILNNLGVALFRLREAGASSAFERASALKDHRQGDISFNRSLALIFEGRGTEALPSLDTALKANPSDVRSRLLRVWALKTTGRDSERLEEWDRLTAIAPSFAALAVPDLARRLERILSFERNAVP